MGSAGRQAGTIRVAMAQLNPTVGELSGNSEAIRRCLGEARKAKADLVAFPELALTGYPPEDLLFKPGFVADTRRALDVLLPHCRDLIAVIGYVADDLTPTGRSRRGTGVRHGHGPLYNAAAIIAYGKLVAIYAKQHLPNYGVFDENRYFTPGMRLHLVTLNGLGVGVNICEDIWQPEGPTKRLAAAGADLIVNINASPFQMGKSQQREQMLATRARDHQVLVTYTNMVGGQDELVFDGNSVIVDSAGEVIARAKAFEEDFLVADLSARSGATARHRRPRSAASAARLTRVVERHVVRGGAKRPRGNERAIPVLTAPMESCEEVYRALVLGIRDYVAKNRFQRAVIGLSGGVDSALTAVLAVDALGASQVEGLFMPSPFTSQASYEDVAELARRVGIPCKTIPIAGLFDAYRSALADFFAGRPSDATEENLQARIRGTLLMAFSNKFGHLVLTTGNKSEMSVGYATLYGDMAGGFAAIKDVPKTLVYDLTEWRNRQTPEPLVPKRILERPPTAELRPDQRDDDTLPPYAVLDPILKAYVEDDASLDEIAARGFDRTTVAGVMQLVDRSEYKRRQAPVGIKITHRGLGKDRRMPITNRYGAQRTARTRG